MLALLAAVLSFLELSKRASSPDLENGPESVAFDANANALGNQANNDEDEDLDGDDITRDLDDEWDRRRTRTYSESSSFTVPENKPKSTWCLKIRNFLSTETSERDLDSYIPNYRYTPILSGIIIPFSILLEIPGLTENWYIRTEDNKTVEIQPNPAILDVGLAFSMACALAANICLVIRFLEKRVKLMTLGCIVFLTIHDIINIVTLVIFGVEHRFDDGFTYGQSFWITVCSTIVSTFTNVTLITDLLRTPDFDNSGSGLTRRQRSLVIIVILLLCYIALGSLAHTYLMHLDFIDAMYFSLVSIETVGFGDIQPKTTGARVFTCLYAAFGIVLIALTVGLMRETVLEGLEVSYRKRMQEVQHRRKIGRWRRRVADRWREAVEWRLRDGGHAVWVREDKSKHAGLLRRILHAFDRLIPWRRDSSWFRYENGLLLGHGLGNGAHPRGMHLNLEALSWKQLEAAAMEAGVPLDTLLPEDFIERHMARDEEHKYTEHNHRPEVALDATTPLTHARLGRMVSMIGSFALAVHKSSHLSGDVDSTIPSAQNNKSVPLKQPNSEMLHYDAFRTGMETEETKAFYGRLAVVWMLFITFWMIGSVVFMQTEGWSFGVSLYFCFITFMTIGYGDYSPQSPAARSFFVAWALLGVATMTILISVISEGFSSKIHSVVHAGIFDRVVDRYRQRAQAVAVRRGKSRIASSQQQPLSPEKSSEDAIQEAHSRTQTQLEALPQRILSDARTFTEHLSYFVGSGRKVEVDSGEELPPGLQQLMKDVLGGEKLGERFKREILQDEDARQTLFALSIEHALQKIIESAQDALHALQERERLLQHHSLTNSTFNSEEIMSIDS
ncbi:tandem pore domain k+ channel [Favolaschia claudopus]|uniref:Tandem pore domain k+ channel n=1 Tax=Favolaschia claudopus TaxID=2862362 RepID=A0AAW0E9R4_9AGAR